MSARLWIKLCPREGRQDGRHHSIDGLLFTVPVVRRGAACCFHPLGKK